MTSDAETAGQLADQLAEATRRAVTAELEAASLRVTIEQLKELRKRASTASSSRTATTKRWREYVDALLIEVRQFAEIYGVTETLDERIQETGGESPIAVIIEFLGCLAVMEHPSVLYPRPSEQTVRVAEAMVRAELGRPGGTITGAVREALTAAAALQRSKELARPGADGRAAGVADR